MKISRQNHVELRDKVVPVEISHCTAYTFSNGDFKMRCLVFCVVVLVATNVEANAGKRFLFPHNADCDGLKLSIDEWETLSRIRTPDAPQPPNGDMQLLPNVDGCLREKVRSYIRDNMGSVIAGEVSQIRSQARSNYATSGDLKESIISAVRGQLDQHRSAIESRLGDENGDRRNWLLSLLGLGAAGVGLTGWQAFAARKAGEIALDRVISAKK